MKQPEVIAAMGRNTMKEHRCSFGRPAISSAGENRMQASKNWRNRLTRA